MDYVLEKKEAAIPDKIPAFRMRKQQSTVEDTPIPLKKYPIDLCPFTSEKQQETETVQRQSDASKDTGIPSSLLKRFENLTGYSFNNVKVHYNSEKPARMQALALHFIANSCTAKGLCFTRLVNLKHSCNFIQITNGFHAVFYKHIVLNCLFHNICCFFSNIGHANRGFVYR